MSIVDRNLEPRVVYNHPSGRILRIHLKWKDKIFMIPNIYAPNRAKKRMKLWKDRADISIEGEWCIMGDFNMVVKKIKIA